MVAELRDVFDIQFVSVFKSTDETLPELASVPVSTLFDFEIDNRFYKAVQYFLRGEASRCIACLRSALLFFFSIPAARIKTARLLKGAYVVASAPAAGMFISSKIRYILEIHTSFEYFWDGGLLGRFQPAMMTSPALTVFRNKNDAEKGASLFRSDYLYNTFSPPIYSCGISGKKKSLSSCSALFVGRLVDSKNPEMLLDVSREILKVVPDFRLDIYGDGELRASLSKRIQDEGLSSNVALCGYTDDRSVYSDYDILMLTSSFEGFGMVIVEAAAFGVPCVSTNWGAASREIIQDGVTGFVADDKVEFISRCLDLLLDSSKREQMGNAAREDYQKRFSPEVHRLNWVRILRSVYGDGRLTD